MKKILLATAVIALTTATAFAQMNGTTDKQHEGMMGGQMMNHEVMRNMSGMMEQMHEMMHTMVEVVEEHKGGMDHAKMQDMGKMMHEMAGQMEEMATHMEQGKMDQGTVKKMHEKMQLMNKKLNAMQKGDK